MPPRLPPAVLVALGLSACVDEAGVLVPGVPPGSTHDETGADSDPDSDGVDTDTDVTPCLDLAETDTDGVDTDPIDTDTDLTPCLDPEIGPCLCTCDDLGAVQSALPLVGAAAFIRRRRQRTPSRDEAIARVEGSLPADVVTRLKKA